MADVGNDVEQLNTALAAMAERATSDPAYRDSLKANQVEALQDAGVSALALAGVFAELGADEDEVTGFGWPLPGNLKSTGEGSDPSELVVNTICIRTCVRQTITITIGCSRSF